MTVWAKLASALPKPIFMADLRFNERGRYTFGETPYKETDIRFWDGSPKENDFGDFLLHHTQLADSWMRV